MHDQLTQNLKKVDMATLEKEIAAVFDKLTSNQYHCHINKFEYSAHGLGGAEFTISVFTKSKYENV